MGASSGIIMGASALGNAYSQNSAYQTKAKYEMAQVQANQTLAGFEETSALKAGDVAADSAVSRGNVIAGKQLASYGAQGVDVHSGSAAAETSQTTQMASIDAITAHNNAWRQAWGIAQQTLNITGQGTMTALADQANGNNSLINGGMSAAGDFAKGGAYYKQNLADRGPSSSNGSIIGGGAGGAWNTVPTGDTTGISPDLSPNGLTYTGTTAGSDFNYNSTLWGNLED